MSLVTQSEGPECHNAPTAYIQLTQQYIHCSFILHYIGELVIQHPVTTSTMAAQPSKRSTPKTQATPESQTQFLYLILKQLDLKTVNWQDVADGIGIKNGHAARMRWSRFKAQTEGLPTQATKKKQQKNGEKECGGKDVSKRNGGSGAGGGLHEAMMDDRETKRVKTEHHGFPGGMPMPYPPPPPPWGPYPPHTMVKPDAGVPLIKMEQGGDMHAPPCGPWFGPMIPGQMMPPPPMNENVTPMQIFAMHGHASNTDPDDLPIKQGQLGVPGTVNMADLSLPQSGEEQSGPECTTTDTVFSSTVDDASGNNTTSTDQNQPPAAPNQPSPPLHSIPLHQPGPDSPPASSTDDLGATSTIQPTPPTQKTSPPPSYESSQQQQHLVQPAFHPPPGHPFTNHYAAYPGMPGPAYPYGPPPNMSIPMNLAPHYGTYPGSMPYHAAYPGMGAPFEAGPGFPLGMMGMPGQPMPMPMQMSMPMQVQQPQPFAPVPGYEEFVAEMESGEGGGTAAVGEGVASGRFLEDGTMEERAEVGGSQAVAGMAGKNGEVVGASALPMQPQCVVPSEGTESGHGESGREGEMEVVNGE